MSKTLLASGGGKIILISPPLARAVRIVVGLALIAFALGLVAPGTGWNWIGWSGVVPLLTALVGHCPVYCMLKRPAA